MSQIHSHDLSDRYYRHYAGQMGGSLAAFHGSRHQNGEGLGDILRSIGRFLLPIIGPIASTAATHFIKSTSSGMDEGKSLRDAAKGALAPTLTSTLTSASDQIMGRLNKFQTGGRRKRRRGTKKVAKTRKTKAAPKRRVYKAKRKGTKSKSKRIRFLNPNF